ncbi:hypothetical protein [Halorussus halobius]|uniref:hypothetical protein n=1 Tax=Halorussus halobius TaxID=1710537 RepID=UPI00109316C9|nr:hypothetical protein [Halorussus halobius]
MVRSIELSGDSFGLLVYAFQLVGLVALLVFVASPVDSPAGLPLAALLASLVVATAVGAWRGRTDDPGPEHVGTAEDVAYDPFADPGQAARDRWERAVGRLPGDDERD